MSRAAWLAARQGTDDQPTVGGSDLGTILGLSPWGTPLSLWLERTGRVERAQPDEVMQAGQFLEDGILRWYAAQTNRVVVAGRELVFAFTPAARLQGTPLDRAIEGILERATVAYHDDTRLVLRSRQYPWLSASLDALVFDPRLGWGVLDAKNTSMGTIDDWTEGAPEHLRAQIAGYCLVTGLAWGGFSVLFSGRKLGWSDEPRDELLEARCLRASRDFIQLLASDTAPKPDLVRGDTDALRALHRDVSARTLFFPTTVLLDGDRVSALDFDEQYRSAKEDLRFARQRDEILETHLRALMGDAREILLPSGARYRRNETKVWRRSE